MARHRLLGAAHRPCSAYALTHHASAQHAMVRPLPAVDCLSPDDPQNNSDSKKEKVGEYVDFEEID